MPHICARCGKEYPDASDEVLRGCVCGNTSFLYQRSRAPGEFNKEIPRNQTNHEENIPDTPSERTDDISLESVRIIRPGEYDINLVQMAQSPDRVIKIGQEGEYRLDLHSMVRKKKK